MGSHFGLSDRVANLKKMKKKKMKKSTDKKNQNHEKFPSMQKVKKGDMYF